MRTTGDVSWFWAIEKIDSATMILLLCLFGKGKTENEQVVWRLDSGLLVWFVLR